MVDDPLLQREGAHSRGLARVARGVGPRHRGDLRQPLAGRFEDRRRVHRAIVVFDLVRALLLLRERDVEVEIEVAPERRGPRKRPAHSALVRLEGLERRLRHSHYPDVEVLEVDDEAVEAVGDRRAHRAAARVLRPEHEVVHEELGAAAEEVRERRAPLVGLERVLLFDTDPRELLPLLRELVSAAGVVLLGLEQLEPGGEPLLTCSCPMVGHRPPFVSS